MATRGTTNNRRYGEALWYAIILTLMAVLAVGALVVLGPDGMIAVGAGVIVGALGAR